MAHALKMPVGRYVEETTARQHQGWLAWLEAEWNRPDRGDHYLMAVLAALHSMPAWVWGKESNLSPGLFKLPFGRADEEAEDEGGADDDPYEGMPEEWRQWALPRPWTPELRAEASKRRVIRRHDKQIREREAAARGERLDPRLS